MILDGTKTFILGLTILAGGFALIFTGRQDALDAYWKIAAAVAAMQGVREISDKGGLVQFNKPAATLTDTKPGA